MWAPARGRPGVCGANALALHSFRAVVGAFPRVGRTWCIPARGATAIGQGITGDNPGHPRARGTAFAARARCASRQGAVPRARDGLDQYLVEERAVGPSRARGTASEKCGPPPQVLGCIPVCAGGGRECSSGRAAGGGPGSQEGRMIWSALIRTIVGPLQLLRQKRRPDRPHRGAAERRAQRVGEPDRGLREVQPREGNA